MTTFVASAKNTMANARPKFSEPDPDVAMTSYNPREMDRRAIRSAAPAMPVAVDDGFPRPRTISVDVAARRVGKSRKAVQRWCREFGIGKRLSERSEWRIDPVALVLAADGDLAGLQAHLSRSPTPTEPPHTCRKRP